MISRVTGQVVRVVIRIGVEVRGGVLSSRLVLRVRGGRSRNGPGLRPRICGSISWSGFIQLSPSPPPPHRGSEANQRDHPGAGADGAHHWHAPTSKSMSDDHRTGRLCADAARLARRHFVRKSMRPRMSSRGLSMPARARRVNLFGSSTYGREESCRMQVLCSSVSQPSKKQARLAVHASQLVRARLRLNEHSCPRERQTCTTFAEPPEPKRAVRKKVPSSNALLLPRYFTSVHTTAATMAVHRHGTGPRVSAPLDPPSGMAARTRTERARCTRPS